MDWSLVAVAIVAGLAGGFLAVHEGRSQVYAGQAPTLEQMRTVLQRLRRWATSGSRDRLTPAGWVTVLEDLELLDRAMKDLTPPARRRRRRGEERRRNMTMELPEHLERRGRKPASK